MKGLVLDEFHFGRMWLSYKDSRTEFVLLVHLALPNHNL